VVSETPVKLFEGIRVLVVDDSEINRRVLHHQLVQWGIDHDVVASGPAALLAMRQAWVCGRPFQVALVDHFMPEMSGEELGRRISADPDLNKTALILLTSAAQRRDATWISEAGFQACFMKPIVRMNALLEALSNAIVPFKDPFAHLNTPPTREMAPARAFDLARPVSGRSKNPEAKYKVLLVEDNLVNQKLAVLMLQRLGCGVDLALNGRVGYEMANRAKYDLVFMDCHMPEMDGFEATRLIREKQPRDPLNGKSLVVVALTASVLPEDQQRCFDAGMDDFITKPLKSADLQAVIRRWLETNEGREAMVARGGQPMATFRASLPTPV
jgi:CheY-like chemotaxis protein